MAECITNYHFREITAIRASDLRRRTQKNLCGAIRAESVWATRGVHSRIAPQKFRLNEPAQPEACCLLEFQSPSLPLSQILITHTRLRQRVSDQFRSNLAHHMRRWTRQADSLSIPFAANKSGLDSGFRLMESLERLDPKNEIYPLTRKNFQSLRDMLVDPKAKERNP
jgi:hypothetical protein